MSNLEWLDALRLNRTMLPQLPTLEREELGQPESSKDDLPQPHHAARAEKKDGRVEHCISSSLERVGRETNSAAERDIQTAWAEGFLNCWQMLLQGGLLVYPVQQEGQDCRGCKHITMTTENHDGTRRKFFWRCELGHRQLEMGLHGGRVIIAPSECRDYESPEEKKWS